MSDDVGRGDPRVLLAIERTYLAWTRTALALMGFGFVVARLGLFLREMAAAQPSAARMAPVSVSLSLGTILVILGVLVQGLALLERRALVRRFAPEDAPEAERWWSLARLVGLTLIAIGVAMTAYLLSL